MALEKSSWAQEIFGSDKEISFEDQLQQTQDIRSDLPWESDPLWQQRKAENYNRLPAKILDDAFKVEVCGDLPTADEAFGIVRLSEPVRKALRIETAAPSESSLENVFAKVSGRIVSAVTQAPARRKRIDEIIGTFKAALAAKGYARGVEDFGSGWERLAANMEKFVAESVMTSG